MIKFNLGVFGGFKDSEMLEGRVVEQTLTDYTRIVGYFWDFYEENDFPMERQVEVVDVAGHEYVTYVYRYNLPKSRVSKLMASLVFFNPLWKGRLPILGQSLKGFNRKVSKTSHFPLPFDVFLGMVSKLASENHMETAVALLLAWDCKLRISEVVNRQVGDIILPGDPRFIQKSRRKGLVVIVKSKGKVNQMVRLRSKLLVKLLRRWIGRKDWKSTKILEA